MCPRRLEDSPADKKINNLGAFCTFIRILKELDLQTNCIFEAVADEDTIIFSKYAPGGNDKSTDFIFEEGGYLNLSSKLERHLSDGFSTCYQNTVLATVWSRY